MVRIVTVAVIVSYSASDNVALLCTAIGHVPLILVTSENVNNCSLKVYFPFLVVHSVTPTFYGTVLEASVQPAAAILRKFSDGGYLGVQEAGTCPMRGRTSLGRQGS